MIDTLPINKERPLRVGILGAARITPMALLAPAERVDDVEIAAVAARDRGRAEKFARKHRIAHVHDSYDALIRDPTIDALYNPLPNSLHCEWTIRGLEAGKHVLCEKPLASNADEARTMTLAAEQADRVLMEAFHWRYHPVAEHMRDLIHGGKVGPPRHIEAAFCIPLLAPNNIRYDPALAGGSTMDLGAYTVNMIRFFGGPHAGEPEVISARARKTRPEIDRWMRAELAFESGCTARMTVALCSWRFFRLTTQVDCEDGVVELFNPIAPHVHHRLTVRARAERSVKKLAGEPTYVGQLRAFVRAIRTGEAPPSDGHDGVKNMAVIDQVYEHAGMRPRGR